MIPRRSADQNRQRPHRCSIPERCRPQIRKYAKHHTPTPTNRAERDKVMLAYQDAGLQVARHRDKRSAKPSCRMPRRAGTCPQAQRWSATLSSGKQSNIDPFRLQYILRQIKLRLICGFSAVGPAARGHARHSTIRTASLMHVRRARLHQIEWPF